MEEKLRKMFNITSPFPPIKSLPPKSPPSDTRPPTSTEQNMEPKPLRTSSNGVSLARAIALEDAESTLDSSNKVILSEKEEAIILKEQELQKREYNLSILEREMDQKLAEIVHLDNELRTKLASVSKKEVELAKREAIVAQHEAIIKVCICTAYTRESYIDTPP